MVSVALTDLVMVSVALTELGWGMVSGALTELEHGECGTD